MEVPEQREGHSQDSESRLRVHGPARPNAPNLRNDPTPLPLTQALDFAPPTAKGLYLVAGQLLVNGEIRRTYHSAFWIRDLDYLRSGPKLGVNENYFELDGKPLAVVGTTYMSSEVQRLYFDHPNVYVWDRDLRQIHDAGLNMIRTGWWTGWDKFADENGQPYERTLRTMEAYLMTARKYGLPVQFNFFAFLPEVLGRSESVSRSRSSPQTDHAGFGRGRAFSRRSVSRV